MKIRFLINTSVPCGKLLLMAAILVFGSLPMISNGQGQTSQSDTLAYKSSNIMLPAISTSPETSLLVGGVFIRQFKLGTILEEARTSTALISAVYTLKNQLSIGFFPSLFLPNETWVLEGDYAFSYFPESFWGIGRKTYNNDEIKVISRQVFLQQSLLHKVYPKIFTGPQLRWSNTYDISFEDPEGGNLPVPAIQGAHGSTSFGVGGVFRWDDRNKSTTPTDGEFIQFSFITNPSWLGTGRSYTTYIIDTRKYLELSDHGRSVLAFQGLIQLRSGTPPFNDLATLGGESIMRGYYAGRYRDQNGAQLQTELRQHLIGRLGFAVFAATGQVWPSFDNINIKSSLWSGGGGLRFNLSKQEPLNLRVDMAFGQNTTGFYITLGEAF